MEKRVHDVWKNFLRGARSVLNLQPRTREARSEDELVFARAVTINGRTIRLDAKRNLSKSANRALASDWRKITGDLNTSFARLPDSACAHAKR